MGKTGGITTDADGHLYLSSDHGAAIYRISHSPLIGSWEHTLPTPSSSAARSTLRPWSPSNGWPRYDTRSFLLTGESTLPDLPWRPDDCRSSMTTG